MMTFVESGVRFSFPKSDCFRIEDDEIVVGKDSVKACECLAKTTRNSMDTYWFIEAKSSAPKENICDRTKITYSGNPIDTKWSILTNFDNFVNDICQKFEDSFSLCHAMTHGYHGITSAHRIPSGCSGFNNKNVKFVLIIKNFKEEWFPPLNDAIKKRLRHFLNAWNIHDIAVKTLNVDGAIALGLPVSRVP